jgi:hypothetical protein
VAASGAALVTLASLDLETACAWRFRTPADTPVIVGQLISFAALSISAIVPLWTARAVLGVIVRLFLERRSVRDRSPHGEDACDSIGSLLEDCLHDGRHHKPLR